MNTRQVITAVQKRLVALGHKISVDGVAGPQTWGAIYSELHGNEVEEQLPDEKVDDRSEKNIATLHPKARPYARALVNAAEDQGITIKVTSGTRTYAEQNALYEQGRTKPGSIVTGARGGYSNHNFGIAFDVTIFQGAKPIYESPQYKAVGVLGRALGLEWGGDWKSFVDEPHFQLRPEWAEDMTETQMLSELRRRKSTGKDAFA